MKQRTVPLNADVRKALTAYLDTLTKQTTDFAATAESEIAALQAQIAEKRKAVEAAQQKQASSRAAAVVARLGCLPRWRSRWCTRCNRCWARQAICRT